MRSRRLGVPFEDAEGNLWLTSSEQGLIALRPARVEASRVVRATDLAARYGGEEFAVLLPETNLEGAVAVAEGIRNAIVNLEITHEHSHVAGILTISCGVACTHPTLDTDRHSLIAAADKALYQAKGNGRNRVWMGAL